MLPCITRTQIYPPFHCAQCIYCSRINLILKIICCLVTPENRGHSICRLHNYLLYIYTLYSPIYRTRYINSRQSVLHPAISSVCTEKWLYSI